MQEKKQQIENSVHASNEEGLQNTNTDDKHQTVNNMINADSATDQNLANKNVVVTKDTMTEVKNLTTKWEHLNDTVMTPPIENEADNTSRVGVVGKWDYSTTEGENMEIKLLYANGTELQNWSLNKFLDVIDDDLLSTTDNQNYHNNVTDLNTNLMLENDILRKALREVLQLRDFVRGCPIKGSIQIHSKET